jgi:hypothetical protein
VAAANAIDPLATTTMVAIINGYISIARLVIKSCSSHVWIRYAFRNDSNDAIHAVTSATESFYFWNHTTATVIYVFPMINTLLIKSKSLN